MGLAASAGANAAPRINFNNPAFALTANAATSIPVGHADFCRAHADECMPNANFVEAMTLTQARWQELVEVNAQLNQSIVPVTDEQLYRVEEFWTYPNGYGDCEDFALAKRRELIELGWAPSTLLLAVVRQANGDGHAVLMVRTDRGDLVLDNQEGLIKLWNDTPYRFLKRQSQLDAGQWVEIYDSHSIQLATR